MTSGMTRGMTPGMSPGTVFPIGHYCGTSPQAAQPGGAAGEQPDAHLVRVGEDLHQLTDEEFGIWMLAHGLADVGRGEWSTQDIRERASDARIADPTGRIEALLDRGLLAQVPTRTERADESVAFASGYRLVPLLVGLGTVPGRPDQHAIGVPGVGTAALLDPGCYELWRQAAVAATLWQFCQERLAQLTSATSGGLELVDPARLLGALLGELRVLIVHGCGYLDVAAVRTESAGEPGGEPGTEPSGEPDTGPGGEPDRTGTATDQNVPE